jgi:hypothetical protein
LIEVSGDFSLWQEVVTNRLDQVALGEPVGVAHPLLLDQPGLFFRATYLRRDE